MTGLEGDDVVWSFVAVAFTGEAVAIEGKVAMTAAFGGLWAAVAGIVRVLLVEGLVAARSARWWVPPASCWWAPLRRVGATGSPLAGHRESPCVAAEVTPWLHVVPWFNVVKVRGTPCGPDGHELARCPAGSFGDWGRGTDHQSADVQVG